jgi:hypothetical protein
MKKAARPDHETAMQAGKAGAMTGIDAAESLAMRLLPLGR